jgi:hypothetical protein
MISRFDRGDDMAKFRKKPVVIEAVQWNGENLDECIAFLQGSYRRSLPLTKIRVITLEGEHIASVGDWLIKGINGERYLCKPDRFAAIYEAVE